MKVIVLTPIWKRPRVTEIYCAGLSRLIEYGKTIEINIEPILVVSPEDKTGNKKILKKYGFKYLEAENKLGYKKNVGLRAALKKRFNYLMELNSDDIIENDLLDIFKRHMKSKVPFIGIQNFGVIDGINQKAKHKYKSSCLFGIARMYSKESLIKASTMQEVEGVKKYIDGVRYIKPGSHYIYPLCKANALVKEGLVEPVGKPFIKLWDDDLMRGLDNNSEAKFAAVKIFPLIIRTNRPLAFDIKTDQNIWPYKEMSGEKYSFLQMIEKLPLKEQRLIKQLKDGIHRG